MTLGLKRRASRLQSTSPEVVLVDLSSDNSEIETNENRGDGFREQSSIAIVSTASWKEALSIIAITAVLYMALTEITFLFFAKTGFPIVFFPNGVVVGLICGLGKHNISLKVQMLLYPLVYGMNVLAVSFLVETKNSNRKDLDFYRFRQF